METKDRTSSTPSENSHLINTTTMIYILGGSGYVSQAYQKLLIDKGSEFKNIDRKELDYSDVAQLQAALEADQPEFLINAAGYTGKPNVDACESDKMNCLFGNAILPGRIAEACEATETLGVMSLPGVSTQAPVKAAQSSPKKTRRTSPSARTTAPSIPARKPSEKKS